MADPERFNADQLAFSNGPSSAAAQVGEGRIGGWRSCAGADKRCLSHVPPRPKADPQAPGMFAFADPQRVSQVLTAAGWAPPQLDKLDCDLDIAAGRGLEEAVVQSTQIGAVDSWLRGPEEVVTAAVASIREAHETRRYNKAGIRR